MKRTTCTFLSCCLLTTAGIRHATAAPIQDFTDVVWTAPVADLWPPVPFAFTPDESAIAAPGDDGTLKFWRVSDGLLLRSLPLNGGTKGLALSPDGTLYANSGGSIVLARTSDGTTVSQVQNRATDQVVFSPDGALLASRDNGNYGAVSVRLWSVNDGLKPITNLSVSWPEAIAFSPDAKLLAAGSWAAGVNLFAVSNYSLARVLLSSGKISNIVSLAFSPDSRYLAISCASLYLWGDTWYPFGVVVCRVADGAVMWSRPDGGQGVSFSPDGRTFLSAGDLISLTSAQSGNPYMEYYYPIDPDPYEDGFDAWGALFSPSGRYYALTVWGLPILVLSRTPLWISETSRGPTGTALRWSGGTGLYQVQQSTDLGPGAWQNVGIPTTNTSQTVLTTNPATFFRIQSLTNAP